MFGQIWPFQTNTNPTKSLPFLVGLSHAVLSVLLPSQVECSALPVSALYMGLWQLPLGQSLCDNCLTVRAGDLPKPYVIPSDPGLREPFPPYLSVRAAPFVVCLSAKCDVGGWLKSNLFEPH